MRLLIQNGLLHTQSALGVFQGDIYTEDARIVAVGRQLEAPADVTHVIDATGLHVCPGLIDAHMHLIRAADTLEHDLTAIAHEALHAGVTTCALWPGDGQACMIRHGEHPASAPGLVHLTMDGKGDRTLLDILQAAVRGEYRLACEVYGVAQAKRILALIRGTGAQVILTHLNSCSPLADWLEEAACPTILGACCFRGQGNAYALAAELQQRGLTVALTGDYPATKLHYLPMSAGLCVQAGLDAEAALRMVTLDAARLLGVAEEVGSIEPGKRADLAIFDGDPLRLASSCVMTITGGCAV